jgi:recombination protein RecA
MRNPPKAAKKVATPAPNAPIDISKFAAVIRKQFGDTAIQVPGKDADFMLRRISDWLDVGKYNEVFGNEARGIPCGYYTELSGEESAGKSTLGYCILAWAQAAGYVAWLADVEHSFDVPWAVKQGVDTNNLLIIESAYEQGKKFIVDNVDKSFEKWEDLIRQAWAMYQRPQILLIDSIAALLPKEQLEGEYGERSVGALARALAVNLPKFHSALIETKTACIIVNQLRDSIGVMFGEKEHTTGGRAKNFYFSSRVQVKRMKTLAAQISKTEKKPYAILSRVKNKKNKVGVPFREVKMEINFDTGIV